MDPGSNPLKSGLYAVTGLLKTMVGPGSSPFLDIRIANNDRHAKNYARNIDCSAYLSDDHLT